MNTTVIIIVHFGNPETTIECLRSVYSNAQAPLSIVIDNSEDSGLKAKTKIFKKVILIAPGKNLGFSGANNLGIKKANDLGAEYFLLLNNDTVVPMGFFNRLVSYAENTPQSGIICPKIYFAKGYEFKKIYSEKEVGRVIWYAGGIIDWKNVYAHHRGVDEVDNGQYDKIEKTDFATGCAMLIKKEVIDKIGLLDENYFLYFEDVEFSRRAAKNGFQILYYPKVHIYHKNAGSSQGPGSVLHQYYQTRNRIYFGFKYAGLRTRLALLKESVNQIIAGGVRRKAVTDFYFNRMGKAVI